MLKVKYNGNLWFRREHGVGGWARNPGHDVSDSQKGHQTEPKTATDVRSKA